MKFIVLLTTILIVSFGALFLKTSSPASAQNTSTSQTLVIGIISLDFVLAEYAPDIIDNARVGTLGKPNLTAVFLYDVYSETDSTIYTITNGDIASQSVPKVDVGSPTELAQFVNATRTAHPTDKTFLTLVGHGFLPFPQLEWVGDEIEAPQPLEAGYGYQESFPSSPLNVPMTPLNVPMTPLNVPMTGEGEEDGYVDYDFLSTPEIGEFLALATNNGDEKFDVLLFDQCFQGSMDTLYEVKDSAEIIIASPNYGWASYPYDNFLHTFASDQSNEAIADGILSDYQTSLDNEHPNSIFWISSSDIDALGAHVSDLGTTLIDLLEAGQITHSDILALQSNLRYVDSNLNIELNIPDEYVTLHSLASALQSLNHPDINPKTTAILDLLDNLGREYRAGAPHVNPNVTWSFGPDDTVTILSPLANTTDPETIWHSLLYADPTTQLTVTVEDNHAVGTVTQPLAFAQEGTWDDFINYWYPDQTSIAVSPWLLASPNLVSESLFDFEDNTQWAHHYSRAANSEFVDGTLQINYNNLLPENTIAFKSSNFSSAQDWSGYNWLTMDIQGQNSGNEIQLYLNGEESGRYMHIFTDDFEGWDTIIVPLDSSGFILDDQEPFDEDSLFAFDDIYRIGIEVRTKNPENISGSIHVDNIMVVSDTSHEILFDFDESPRKWRAHYSSIGRTKIIDGVMHIIYKDLAPSQYFAHKSRNVPVPVWGEYQTISFFIKGENTGHKVTVNLDSSITGWANYSFVDNSSEWREIVIAINDFHSRNGRPTDIESIGFQIKNQSPLPSNGVIQIDNIRLNQ